MPTRLPLLLSLGLALAACDEPPTAEEDAGGAADAGPRGDTDAGPVSDVDAGPVTDADAGPITDTDAGPSRLPAAPSAGCGEAAPATGARTITVSAGEAAYLLSIPAGYDASQPYPLGFAFHGANRTHENCRDGDCRGVQSVMGERAILIYPKSFSDGWPYPSEIREDNVELFEAILARTLEELCVDESRVFVTGTSSGATFSNVLACRFGDRLLATIPVAGGLPEREGCVGTVAALVVHGVDDYHVGFDLGEEARDFYVAQSGCTDSPEPALEGLHARVVAERESYECADYPGCAAATPVRWCEHSEGGYDGSTHGWPTFGGQVIWDFVSAL